MNNLIKYGVMAGVAVAGAVIAYKNRNKIKPAVARVKKSWNNLDKSDRKVIVVAGSVVGATALAVGAYALGMRNGSAKSARNFEATAKMLEYSMFQTDRAHDLTKRSIEATRRTRALIPRYFERGYRMGWRDAGGELPTEFSERAVDILNKLNGK